MPSKKKLWSYDVGEKGERVVVYERERAGILYVRYWNDEKGERDRRSLGHRDKEAAKELAARGREKLAAGELLMDADTADDGTLLRVFNLYLQEETPNKRSPQGRAADERRVAMWKRFLGANRDPQTVTLRDCTRFVAARRSGAIDSHGNAVREKKREVRDRTVEADGDWLNTVFRWAANWPMDRGRYLMREDPIRGFKWPTEKNPRRPVASHDRYEAVRAVTDEVVMEVRWSGRRETQRSYLSEVFDIAMDTGRRLTPVCELRYSDLRLSEGRHGKIHWPGDTDKEGREWKAPLGPIARAAIDRVLRERPGIGSGYLFPSPVNPLKPISRHLADDWLREAEMKAKLEPQKGSLWHAYRRKWATERKDFPDVDVAAAGGWRGVETLKLAYQQADEETMEQVVLEPKRLREAK